MLGYCQAKIDGRLYGKEYVGWRRCTRLARRTENEKVLCTQHANQERKRGDVRV